MRKIICTGLLSLLLGLSIPQGAYAQPQKSFNVGWSIYVTSMPWGWAADNGIVKKWADKFGISIKVTKFTDYLESLNQYTSGQYDAVVATTMDAMATPAVGGVDSTVVVIFDYSNGNDALILKGKNKSIKDVKGQKVHLTMFSVNHYTLFRALESAGLSLDDVTLVNLSDVDQVAAFSTGDVTAVAAFHPVVYLLSQDPNASVVFDSSMMPGAILDMMIAHTDVVKDNPDFAKALAGIWFETLSIVLEDSDRGRQARRDMGIASGTDLAGFEAQLATTHLFSQSEHKTFTESDQIKASMDALRSFMFDQSLLGQDAKSSDEIGIEFPSGDVMGREDNIKLRFTNDYTEFAREELGNLQIGSEGQ